MKENNKSNKIILAAIILLAFFLRFYKLGEIPPGVNSDEASLSYNAYSILKTARDEYGSLLPLSIKAFGDWKLPLYVYLDIPFLAVFNLSDWTARLPSALFGVLSVIVVYYLVKEFFPPPHTHRFFPLPLLTAFLLAVSPWHIHFSREASEANLAVFFVSLGVLFFLMAINHDKGIYFLPSVIFLVSTYYTYHGNHIFTSLLILGLLFLYFRKIKKERWVFISTIVFCILFLIIISQTLFNADKTKISGSNLFADPALIHREIELPRLEHGLINNSLGSKALHNRLVYALEIFARNYVKSFSPEFLFIKGGENKAHNIPDFGKSYLVLFPVFLIGLYALWKVKARDKWLILWWLAISPLAASITRGAPHSARMICVLPVLQIILALGILTIFQYTKNINYRRALLVSASFLFAINFLVYLDRYFVHFPLREGENWGIAYKQLSEFLEEQTADYKEIIISRPQESPYIFLLFYQNYDPLKFQQEVIRYPQDKEGFHRVKSFGRYTFRDINYPEDLRTPNRLLIDKTLDMSTWATSSSYLVGIDAKGRKHSIETRVRKQIETLGGKPVFTILETYSKTGEIID